MMQANLLLGAFFKKKNLHQEANVAGGDVVLVAGPRYADPVTMAIYYAHMPFHETRFETRRFTWSAGTGNRTSSRSVYMKTKENPDTYRLQTPLLSKRAPAIGFGGRSWNVFDLNSSEINQSSHNKPRLKRSSAGSLALVRRAKLRNLTSGRISGASDRRRAHGGWADEASECFQTHNKETPWTSALYEPGRGHGGRPRI